MRIVSGKYRGRVIEAPPGRDIRPTADRVRESAFNIIEHGKNYARPGGGSPIEGTRVLDCFAGTGALGLEALSRGAASAFFMDTDTRPCRTNIDALGAADDTRLIRDDCLKPRKTTEPRTLIFMDPPYNKGMAAPALEALKIAGWIAEGAICVVELAATESFEPPKGFTIIEERRYGAARVIFLIFTP